MTDDNEVNFGYQRVSQKEKTRRVNAVFDSVASRYDLMNDLMSAGVHRWWKSIAVQWSAPRPGQRILDLAGGTGDMAMRYTPYICSHRNPAKQGFVVIGDINESMLTSGRDKLLNKGYCENIHWARLNAEALPFADQSFDLVSIAFGLRNISNITKALKEMLRTLKAGGRLIVLEFSKPKRAAVRRLYDMYSELALPKLGKIVAGDASSYQYLHESIRTHPDQNTLLEIISDAGFVNCDYKDLSGGIVSIHRGYRKT